MPRGVYDRKKLEPIIVPVPDAEAVEVPVVLIPAPQRATEKTAAPEGAKAIVNQVYTVTFKISQDGMWFKVQEYDTYD